MKRPWNFHVIARPLLAAVLALIVALSVTRPALADGAASTRNIMLGAAAAIAGIIIYNNIHHKQVAHKRIVGYTRDGGTVYADGRIVYPNGDVLYTGIARSNNFDRCLWVRAQDRSEPAATSIAAGSLYAASMRVAPHQQVRAHDAAVAELKTALKRGSLRTGSSRGSRRSHTTAK